jgi:hypothetical protein
MKKTIITISTIFLFIPTVLKCQSESDSIEVNKIADTYIEITTLRYKLDTSYATTETHMIYDQHPSKPGYQPHYLDGIYIKRQFVPKPIVIKNGTVIIKDRQNKPLDIYIYQDSVLIQHDQYFINGGLCSQAFDLKKDSLNIYKYFYRSGKLSALTYQRQGLEEIFKYDENGKLIQHIK